MFDKYRDKHLWIKIMLTDSEKATNNTNIESRISNLESRNNFIDNYL